MASDRICALTPFAPSAAQTWVNILKQDAPCSFFSTDLPLGAAATSAFAADGATPKTFSTSPRTFFSSGFDKLARNVSILPVSALPGAAVTPRLPPAALLVSALLAGAACTPRLLPSAAVGWGGFAAALGAVGFVLGGGFSINAGAELGGAGAGASGSLVTGCGDAEGVAGGVTAPSPLGVAGGPPYFFWMAFLALEA